MLLLTAQGSLPLSNCRVSSCRSVSDHLKFTPLMKSMQMNPATRAACINKVSFTGYVTHVLLWTPKAKSYCVTDIASVSHPD